MMLQNGKPCRFPSEGPRVFVMCFLSCDTARCLISEQIVSKKTCACTGCAGMWESIQPSGNTSRERMPRWPCFNDMGSTVSAGKLT